MNTDRIGTRGRQVCANLTDITFVIPSHRSSQNLRELLLDLLNLSVTIQIVLVDTSPNGDVVDFMRNDLDDPRIQTKIVPFGEPGVARNIGLQMALGQWISFIDDDDRLDIQAFERAIRAGCLLDTAQVLSFGYVIQKESGTIQHRQPPTETRSVLLSTTLAFWRYIFRREFLIKHALRFPSGLVGEDIVFLYRAFSSNPEIAGYTEMVYVYRPTSVGASSIRDRRWLVIPKQLSLALSVCHHAELQTTWLSTWRMNILSGLLSLPWQSRFEYVRSTARTFQQIPSGQLKQMALKALLAEIAFLSKRFLNRRILKAP